MSKLAINGGEPVCKDLLPDQNTIGPREIVAANRVLQNGRLSYYRGNWSKEFYGGPEIVNLEHEWGDKFNVKHAVCCNSATSGLAMACAAIGLETGDEVFVTPYSMSCSASIPIMFGAHPVFVDIEQDHFCLDPVDFERKITSKTKAAIVVSLFGQPYDREINNIAEKHGITIIEDAAQAINSIDIKLGKYAGTLGDIGVYSGNFGKHLTAGEFGVCVTNDSDLAMRLRLAMNHSEAVIHSMTTQGNDISKLPVSMVGMNLRATEISAAIMRVQLERLDEFTSIRSENAKRLDSILETIPAIQICGPREYCTHSYYAHAFKWDTSKADGLHRDTYIEAVKAELKPRKGRDGEGVLIGNGYIRPLYEMPLFGEQDGLCPTCDRLSNDELFLSLYHAPNSTPGTMDLVGSAFVKVWENRDELK